jgi:[NiFe] hydrogenase assembly HybE family chaperone
MMNANLHPRVAGLLAQLRHVGDTQMRDLPLYNDALAVEDVGFRVIGDALVGVVITPWFMNAIYLPLQEVSIDWSVIGRKVEHRLPSGLLVFTRGGDEVTGQYDAISLRSPVTVFKNQEMARREAWRHLNRLLSSPETAAKTAEQPESSSRRAFLQGRANGS